MKNGNGVSHSAWGSDAGGAAEMVIHWTVPAGSNGQIVQHVKLQAWIYSTTDNTEDKSEENKYSDDYTEYWDVKNGTIFATILDPGGKNDPLTGAPATKSAEYDMDTFYIPGPPKCTYGYILVTGRPRFIAGSNVKHDAVVPPNPHAGGLPTDQGTPKGWNDAGALDHWMSYSYYHLDKDSPLAEVDGNPL